MLRLIHASAYTIVVVLAAPLTAATERPLPFFYWAAAKTECNT